MKLKEWFGNKYNRHYLVYIFCTLVWYVVNYFRVNGTGGQWAFFNEFIGFSVFLMLVIRYGFKSFFKLIYAGAIVISALAFYPILKAFAPQNDYCLQFAGRYINAVLCILLLIRAFIYFFKEEKRERSIKLSACLVIWALMMLACVASKNQSTWPMWAVVSLGSFYVIPLTREEKVSLTNGLVDGIIINFFIYQGLALLHRPYEVEWIRYCGFFSNSDCSAKFFTVSYAGFLTKYLILKKKDSKLWLQIVTFMFASAMWGFIFFTMTRSGFVGMTFTTLIFLILYKYLFDAKFLGIVKVALGIVIIAVFSIPIIYVSIRYIPALRHHPIFIGRYSETRVHSWDPVDSDKYATFEDVIYSYYDKYIGSPTGELRTTNRILSIQKKYILEAEDDTNQEVKLDTDVQAEVSSLAIDGEKVIEYKDGVNPGADELHPAFIERSYNNTFEKLLGIRKYVYRYYFEKAGFRGNKEEYVTGNIGDGETYTSAHNSTLDFMSRYGYIAGVLFFVFQIIVFVQGLIHTKKHGQYTDIGAVLATLTSSAYFAWGLFYSVAFTGEIMDTLFWISVAFVMSKGSQRGKEEGNTYN